MKLSLGIVFMWLAVACFYIAFQQGSAVTPWQVIQEIVSGATGQGGPVATATAGVPGEFVTVGDDAATTTTDTTTDTTGAVNL